jgi:hypothetical protein
MPATFFRRPEAKHTNKPGKNDNNERLAVADSHNGVIFLRNGREIDVVKPPRKWGQLINATTDRFWAIEVDFDATLDDEFSMTTAKQQVVPSDRIWDILTDKARIFEAVTEMRAAYKKEAAKIRESANEAKKASIAAIENAQKFKTTKPPKDTPARRDEAAKNLKAEAERRSKESGVPADLVERELVAQQQGNPYAVETEDLPGAPFFRCVPRGAQRVLLINEAHPFFTDLYGAPDTTVRTRAALEVMLWTLGEAEIEASPDSDRRRFYEAERQQVWSQYLKDALNSLRTIEVLDDGDEDPNAA